MNIRQAIRELSSRWIGTEYAVRFDVPSQVNALIVHAFVNRIPEGEDTASLHEAWRRLQIGALGGDWCP